MLGSHYDALFIGMTQKPMSMHTIEILEPIQRCAQVYFGWPMFMHMKDWAGPEVRDWYVPTLGMDGVHA